MLRPWLRVAIPDDWTGRLARLGSALLGLLILMAPLLGRLPDEWVALAKGQEWFVRLILLGATAWVIMQLRPLAFLPLPQTIVLLGQRLRVPSGLHSTWLKVAEISTIHVDEHPNGEVFTLAMLNGRELLLCPVEWEGAGRLYVKLAARVNRAKKKRRRERIKTAREQSKKSRAELPPPDSKDAVSLAMGPVTHRSRQTEQ